MTKSIIVLVLSLSTSFSYAKNIFYIDNKDYTAFFYAKLGEDLTELNSFAEQIGVKLKDKKTDGINNIYYFELLPRRNNIEVDGNKFFYDERIKFAIASLGLKNGIANLLEQYKNNGFLDAKITYKKLDKQIKIKVIEGKQTRLCKLNFLKASVDIGFSEGLSISQNQILDKLSRLRRNLIADGFFEAKVKFKLHRTGYCLYLDLFVEKGAQYEIEYEPEYWLGFRELKTLISEQNDPLNGKLIQSRISDLCKERGRICSVNVHRYYSELGGAVLSITVNSKQYPYIKDLVFKADNSDISVLAEKLFRYDFSFYTEDIFLFSLDKLKESLIYNGVRVFDLKYTVKNLGNNRVKIFININAKPPAEIISVHNICDTVDFSYLENQNYSKKLLERFCEKELKTIKDQGYLDAKCHYETRDLGDSVDLKLCFLKNTRFLLGNIYIWGNEKTKSFELSSFLKFKKDEYLNLSKLKEVQDELNLFPAFASVDLQISNYSILGKRYKDIFLFLDERAPRIINYGISYDTDTGVSLSSEFYHRNIFGRLYEFGIGALVRTKFGDSFRFLEYEFFSSLRRNNYTLKTSFSDFDYTSYGKRSFKILFTWLRDNNFDNHFYIQGTLEFAHLHHLLVSLPSDRINFSIRPTYVYNDVDNIFSPTKGIKFYAYLDTIYDFSGVDSLLLKSYFSLKTYYPLYKNDYIIVNYITFGAGYALKNSISIDKRFYLGGATSLRGYDFNIIQDTSFSINSQYLYSATLEFRKKMFWKFWMLGFVDLGDIISAGVSEGPYYSIGAGIRLNTLLGAVTFSYGYVIDSTKRIPSSSYGKLHIALITF